MTKNIIRGFIGLKSNDGHDAPILVVANILKKAGIEVILGGYDLTVDKFVEAVITEGVHFVGISSYNGGHIPFFKAVRDGLENKNYPFIHLIGGGGSTISLRDINLLESEGGIDKIFKSGEAGLSVPFIRGHYDFCNVPDSPEELIDAVKMGEKLAISAFVNLAEDKARLDSMLQEKMGRINLNEDKFNFLLNEPLGENGKSAKEALDRSKYLGKFLSQLEPSDKTHRPMVIGITGRGGSGKSTLTDELVLRYFNDPKTEKRKVAILAVDPTSATSGGALLADRIAFMYATDKNWVDTSRVFIRSMASRGSGNGISHALPDTIKILKIAGYDIFIETYGTGQPDIGIVNLVDQAIYLTTPDLGGATQIAKEEMLHIPGTLVVLNKSELQGARHVSSLLQGSIKQENLFLTTAIEHNNFGVDQLYKALTRHLN